jgi:hypothetical protein
LSYTPGLRKQLLGFRLLSRSVFEQHHDRRVRLLTSR